ncbi:MAG TPA: serine/threonine-protein kinase [Acidimicrobiales bacterium]|nr:serine/threonine-protein kinase [Acidimicrobiales bacterium]
MEARAVVGMIGGRYRLHALLGEGGMARVFDGFDERLERPVAVKILRPETEALPGMRKRFQQEARISARLVHPNIVAVLDYGEDGAVSYLVMERLPGRTLRDEVSRGPMPPGRLTALMSDTLGALAAAHRFGVLHRDIKPSNILIDDDGHARITDFGIAKSFDAMAVSDATSDMTMTGVVLGTPGYLAPERRAGHSATVQSDLYSVGAVMVEALSGRRLLPGENQEAEVPPDFRPIATKALATDPRQRFSSAEEMLHALRERRKPSPLGAAAVAATEPIESGTAVLPAPPRTSVLPSPPAPSSPAHRWRRFLLPGAAALIILLLLLLFVLTPGQPAPQHGIAGSRTTAVHHQAKAGRDPQATAIRQLATSLAGGGLPGDAALATSLEATAAAKAGVERETAAQATLTLAGVLYAGGGISGTQFQDVANDLQSTGASVPTTTVPTTVPTPPNPGPAGKGHDHGGDSGPAGNN